MRGIIIVISVLIFLPFIQSTSRIVSNTAINNISMSSKFELRGDMYLSKNKFSTAIFYYTVAVNSYWGGSLDNKAKLFIKIGATYFNLNDFDKSALFLRKGLSIYRFLKTFSSITDKYMYISSGELLLSNNYRLLGKYDSAIISLNNLKKYLGLFKNNPKFNEYEVLADIYSYKGLTYFDSGHFDSSMYYNIKAIELHSKYPELKHLSYSNYAQIGKILLNEHDYIKSEKYFRNALELAKMHFGKNSIIYAEQLEDLGLVYFESKRYEEALESFIAAYEVWESYLSPDNIQFAYLYNNIADALCALSNFDKSIEYYNKASRLFNKHNKISELCVVYHNLGIMHYHLHNFEISEMYYIKSLDISQNYRKKNNTYTAYTYQRLGQLHYSRKEYKMAIKYFSQAIDELILFDRDTIDHSLISIHDKISSKSELYKSFYLKGICEYDLFKNNFNITFLSNSINSFESALQLMDILKKQSHSRESIMSLNENSKILIDTYIAVLLELHEIDNTASNENKLLRAIERKKYTGLRSIMQLTKVEYNEMLPSHKIASIDTLYKILRRDETKLQELKYSNLGEENPSQRNKLFSSTFALDTHVFSLKQKFPTFNESLNSFNFYKINEIQDILPDTSAILEYYCSENLCVILAISKIDHKIVFLNCGKSIISHKNSLLRSIMFSNSTQFIESSRYLFENLIRPIISILSEISSIIIVPDITLYDLPFETLINAHEQMKKSKNSYLINNYDVTYYFSTYLWADNMKINVQNEYENEFAGFAPLASSENTNQDNSLPYSKNEVYNIADIFYKSGKSSRTNYNQNSTENMILRELTKSRVVHIASHSGNDKLLQSPYIYVVKDPYINSTSQDNVRFKNDGKLDLTEIYNSNTNSELVTLSVCSSGQGSKYVGEGVLSLACGFFYSGANNILYTLWDVSDFHTQKFMLQFYSFIAAGDSYPRALRKTKLHFINSDYLLPIFWSGYVLNG